MLRITLSQSEGSDFFHSTQDYILDDSSNWGFRTYANSRLNVIFNFEINILCTYAKEWHSSTLVHILALWMYFTV